MGTEPRVSESGVYFSLSDAAYSLLLNKAMEACGLAVDTPLMPSRGIHFQVFLEVADLEGTVIAVPGVIIPESMVPSDG